MHTHTHTALNETLWQNCYQITHLSHPWVEIYFHLFSFLSQDKGYSLSKKKRSFGCRSSGLTWRCAQSAQLTGGHNGVVFSFFENCLSSSSSSSIFFFFFAKHIFVGHLFRNMHPSIPMYLSISFTLLYITAGPPSISVHLFLNWTSMERLAVYLSQDSSITFSVRQQCIIIKSCNATNGLSGIFMVVAALELCGPWSGCTLLSRFALLLLLGWPGKVLQTRDTKHTVTTQERSK